jgi:hypothetical protein
MTIRRPALVATIAIAATLAMPSMAAAATPIGAVNWLLNSDSRLTNNLLGGCILELGQGWRGDQDFGANGNRATGSWDLKAGTGSVIGKGESIQFEGLKATDAGKPFKISAPGLELSHGKVYLTGQIRPSRRLALRAPRRQRVAVIAHPRLFSGPAIDNRKRPVPNSFLFAVQGQAKITKPLGDAIERLRCHGRYANPRLPHVRAGSKLGVLTVQLLPTAATGDVTAVTIGGNGFGFSAGDQGDTIPMTAGGGATIDADGNPRFTPPAGTRVPLTCEFGFNCALDAGANIPLPGTLTYAYQGRSTALGGLAVSFGSANATGELPATVAGTLDGAPATVAETPGDQVFPQPTADFLNRMGAALGTTVRGFQGAIRVQLGTNTGPVE